MTEGCAVGSPVSPAAGASPHMEELGSRGFRSFGGTALSYWFTYVDVTWVKIRTQEVEPFTKHINIKFTCQDIGGSSSVFLDCAAQMTRDADTYREPAHTD